MAEESTLFSPTPAGAKLRRTSRQLIRAYEARALKKRPFAIRVADYLTTYFGSIEFLFLNLAGFVVWILLNTGLVPGVTPFDRFPFILLTMLVSLEAIALSTFILMSQNRQADRDRRQADADYRTNVEAKLEIEDLQKRLHRIENEKIERILKILESPK